MTKHKIFDKDVPEQLEELNLIKQSGIGMSYYYKDEKLSLMDVPSVGRILEADRSNLALLQYYEKPEE